MIFEIDGVRYRGSIGMLPRRRCDYQDCKRLIDFDGGEDGVLVICGACLRRVAKAKGVRL